MYNVYVKLCNLLQCPMQVHIALFVKLSARNFDSFQCIHNATSYNVQNLTVSISVHEFILPAFFSFKADALAEQITSIII